RCYPWVTFGVPRDCRIDIEHPFKVTAHVERDVPQSVVLVPCVNGFANRCADLITVMRRQRQRRRRGCPEGVSLKGLKFVPLVGAALALVAVFWPANAYAWGPLAHLEFSRGALESLSAVAPGLRILLQKCWPEFLYGSLAADIIVGKDLARFADHCHNWKVGFSVLARARGVAQTAL